MTHEDPKKIETPQTEAEPRIYWGAAAERFKGKIDEARAEHIENFGDDGSLRLQRLTDLETTIRDTFSVYENRRMSLKDVEEDIKYRIENSSEEEEKLIFQQILNLIDARGLNLM